MVKKSKISKEQLEGTYRFLVELVEKEGLRELSRRINGRDFEYIWGERELSELVRLNGFENFSLDRVKHILMPVLNEKLEEESASSNITYVYSIANDFVVDRTIKLITISFNRRFIEGVYKRMMTRFESPIGYNFTVGFEGFNRDKGYILDFGHNTVDIEEDNEKIKVRTNIGEIVKIEKNDSDIKLNNRDFLVFNDIPRIRNPLANELMKFYFSMEKGGEKEISIQELKERIGLENAYDHYGHFKSKVIKPGFEELAKKTGFSMGFEEVKSPTSKVRSLIVKKLN